MDQNEESAAYETTDPERPATQTPTEAELQQEMPGGRESAGHDPYAALRIREYRAYITGFFVTVIAAQIEIVTARYDIYQKTSSELNLGYIGLALALPMLILTLPAGHIADLFSRRRVLIFTQLLAAICAASLAFLSHRFGAWQHSVLAMYLVLATGAAFNTLGRPARAALLPQLVPKDVFPNAATWSSTIFESASVIGPAVAGGICTQSISVAYLIAAISFLVGTGLFVQIKEPPTVVKPTRGSGLSDLMVGLRFVWRTKLMLAVMTLDLFAVLLGGAVFLLPVFAKDILHVGAAGFGWLSAATSIGAMSMALIQAHRKPIRRAGRALLLAVAGFGCATVVFGFSRNFWLSFLMLILTGACDNISVVIRHTIVQLLTPDSMRGRVSAVNQIFIGSSNELGGLESGLTAAAFGAVWSVAGGGIGTLVVVALIVVVFPQLLRLGALAELSPPLEATSQS